VETALQRARQHRQQVRFADVGTGSGCIAVSIAHHLPHAHGWAIDISAGALAVARDNARRLGAAARIEFVCGDLLECFLAAPLFDFILSNPPYVARSSADELPGMVRDHEPHLALFGGDSGMDLFDRLVPMAAARLARGGFLLLEAGAGQASLVAELAQRAGLIPEEIVEDLRGIPRCVVARRP
jgi:release factor glutamine methyltransferase